MAETIYISDEDVTNILAFNESYFADLKSKRISPAKLSRTISAFANAGGDELYVGIEEEDGAN